MRNPPIYLSRHTAHGLQPYAVHGGGKLETNMEALPTVAESASLAQRYEAVRRRSLDLCAPLQSEDYGVQPIVDASPPKWHLAHTTWFFETFILKPHAPGYSMFHPLYEYLFNSYYNGVGEPFPRANRGHLSRPTLADTLAYRAHVDCAMSALFDHLAEPEVVDAVTLGLHHEQQHQELLLTDIKCILGFNPLHPTYRTPGASIGDAVNRDRHSFREMPGGTVEIGCAADGRFAFDNEQPRHPVILQPFQLGTRLVTNGEYLDFVMDDGYTRPEFWLADGWALRKSGRLDAAPLYWRLRDGHWFEYRLDGSHLLRADTPVVHVSYFEADAYARWFGARLPTESEWESAASMQDPREATGNYVESGALHPLPACAGSDLRQLLGDAWEWTSSAYAPYPGFRARSGKFSEYNGKFMANQMVLRGGSCATPRGHIRTTYRNFFYPPDRWQFSGIRLAKDA